MNRKLCFLIFLMSLIMNTLGAQKNDKTFIVSDKV